MNCIYALLPVPVPYADMSCTMCTVTDELFKSVLLTHFKSLV